LSLEKMRTISIGIPRWRWDRPFLQESISRLSMNHDRYK
jgi:hypothetical protein